MTDRGGTSPSSQLVGVVAALLGAAVVAGCVRATPDAVTTESTAARTVQLQPAYVRDARLQADGRTLVVSAALPAGRAWCGDGLTASTQAEDEQGVWVQLIFDSSLSDVQGACPGERVASATVVLPRALGERTLSIDQNDHWVLEDGALRRCDDQGCHPVVVPAACTSTSYVQAQAQLTDLPRHSMASEVGCDGTWLVLEVWFPGGHVCGDGAPCAGKAAGRWIMRASPQGWHVALASRAAGCGQILAALPAFPERLCRSLKAL